MPTKVGQAGKTYDSYDYAQQKRNKETHKLTEIAMNKHTLL